MFQARPRKRFGQHWLTSDKILQQIVAAADLQPSDRLLEIGPGTGLLTQRLLAQGNPIVAVEIDLDLCRKLRSRFPKTDRLLLLQGDILALDLPTLLADHATFQTPNKVVANIPYYITGPILERLLGTFVVPNPAPFDSIVLLVQQEVAQRLCARPGTKAFGALTVRVQYLADCELICTVPPKAFTPPPKVTSAVVRLTPRAFPDQAEDVKVLSQVVTQGFSQKRKMLRNTLSSLLDREQVLAHFKALAIAPNVRAEDLSVATWVALSNKILKERQS
ncbi:MAG: 16S rRNA (adenine(1518)-N(6)/adenine(1519)-N(6))-dimethyltransferase RsmA [Leptolyngbya sp. RL_3_1]|nr:16S rRNA (adenine(1518)-N(6)/adenine(1519)-N(6))-dimethyltransferase RsmA [Leptolyngbya sp. RL_3_1]